MASNDTKFNLSRWALEHPALTRYLMVALMVLGMASYFQLGQDEDPPFTFRAMVVRTYWPGATAQQVAEQVTDKLERTLQEVPYSDKIRSYSKPGESQIILELKDFSKPNEVPQVWYAVRKKIGDMRGTLPPGVVILNAACPSHSTSTLPCAIAGVWARAANETSTAPIAFNNPFTFMSFLLRTCKMWGINQCT